MQVLYKDDHIFTVVNWILLPVTLIIAFIGVLGIGWTFFGRRAI